MESSLINFIERLNWVILVKITFSFYTTFYSSRTSTVLYNWY